MAKMMKIYKMAKLINKEIDLNKTEIILKCSYCGRWATHPINEKTTRENYIWKKPEQLNTEEYQSVQKEKRISHGICPICNDILKNNIKLKPEEVKELSLKTV